MSTNIKKPKSALLLRFDASHRLLISLLVGAIALSIALAMHVLSLPGVILVTWTAFALCVIALDWVTIATCHPREVRKIARLQDSSRLMIFLFVIFSSLVSIVAIYLLLRSGSTKAETDRTVLLAMGAVIISWWLVHTVFTMRYAHMYYDTPNNNEKREAGGLEFPGHESEPDYMDFVYFSFVLGMTFQVSDVEISSRRIRRLAWAHGLISFAFNTAIVALGINIISGLVSK